MTEKLGKNKELTAELDDIFAEAHDVTGDVSAEIREAIIDNRRQLYRQQIAALKIDYHVAKVLDDDQQMTSIRDAGKRVLKALEALDEIVI